MTLLIAAVLLSAAAATWAAWPLLSRSAAPVADAVSGAVVDAEARRRTALAALRELEYDWLGGKLDDADYRAQRDRLSGEALAAIRAVDEMAGAGEGGEEAAPAAPTRLDAVLAAEAGRHRCGFVNPAGSRFCAGCGKRLR